jgi:hypothetical protein
MSFSWWHTTRDQGWHDVQADRHRKERQKLELMLIERMSLRVRLFRSG